MGIGVRWAVMRRGLSDLVRETWAWHRIKDQAVLDQHQDYPTWVLAGSAMNRLAQWLHVLLIGATLGPVLLGMRGLARRMVMQPLSLLATSAAPVLFQGSTEVEDGAPLRRLFLRALPESLGNLTALKKLFVGKNNLTDLPASLTQCIELKTVDIKGNPMSPDAIARIKGMLGEDVKVKHD